MIDGADAALAAMDSLIEALKQGGALDQGLREGANEGAEFAAQIVPRRSGALALAQTTAQIENGAAILIDANATNPTGQRPSVYGPIVAARAVDFYASVIDERAAAIVQKAFDAFTQAVQP